MPTLQRIFLLFLMATGVIAQPSSDVRWKPPVALENLPVIKELPPLLKFENGQPVASVDDWMARREEIKSIIQYYAYGSLPGRPDRVSAIDVKRSPDASGLGTEEHLTLIIGSQQKLRLRVALYIPNSPGPHPVIIREEAVRVRTPSTSLFLEHDYIVAVYARHDLDPDENDQIGPAQAAWPDHDWATLAVWAWGAMRVVDYLETRTEVDMKHVAISGHSRGGKVALLAGALDERFALVAPNGSGCGGAGSYRIEEDNCETLALITDPKRFSYWFHPRLRWFAGREDRLPFDQHFLKALVAPRALLCTDSLDDHWANPKGTEATTIAAQKVFTLLNVDEKNGLHFRTGQHDSTPEDWQTLLDFAEWHFRGKRPGNPERFRQTPFKDADR